VKIAFADEKIRAICEADATGPQLAEINDIDAFHAVLADILACSHLADFLSLYEVTMTDCSEVRFELSILGGCTMVLNQNHVCCPLVDNAPDFSKITRVKIISLIASND
jgi:hypothetical protein